MQSLDTNIILRLLLRDIPEETEKVIQLLESKSSRSLIVEDVIFFEVVWVLSRQPYCFSREMICHALLKVTGLPQIKCNRPLLAKAIPLYVKHSRLSFIDVCLTIYADFKNATPLLTLDQPLAKQLSNARLLN